MSKPINHSEILFKAALPPSGDFYKSVGMDLYFFSSYLISIFGPCDLTETGPICIVLISSSLTFCLPPDKNNRKNVCLIAYRAGK